MSFADKVVLVTGASSGIGAAIAIAFAKECANVVIVGRNQKNLNTVADECEKYGSKPLVINADVTCEDRVQAMIIECIKKFGKLNVLVNNAGIVRFGSLLNGDMLKGYDEIMNTNMRAQILVTSEAIKHLMETKGNIINISSIAGSTVPKGISWSPYYISKAALNHFSVCTAFELSQYGVRVNAVSPGPVRTDIMKKAGSSASFERIKTLLGRISDPEEVADVVLFLASDRAKGITGSNYVVDNGYGL